MITNFLLTLAYNLAAFIISFFPVHSGLPSEVTDAGSLIVTLMGYINVLIPVNTILNAMVFIGLFEVQVVLIKIILWLAKPVQMRLHF